MISFTPPELKAQIIQAKGLLEETLYDWDFYPLDDNYDPDEYDDVEVTADTWISVCLKNALEPVEITVDDFLWMADCLAKGKAVGRGIVVVPGQTIFYISPSNGRARGIAYDAYDAEEDGLGTKATLHINGIECTVSLTRDFNPFHIFAEKYFDCDEKVYPSYGEYDVFAVVSYSGELALPLAKNVLDSFLYQLATCHNIDFASADFPLSEFVEPVEYDRFGEGEGARNLVFRDLDISKGMPELYGLYLEGVTANSNQWAFVSFAKVVEYVSMTVVKRAAHSEIRARLLTPEALRPDAAFMDGLIDLVNQQRDYAKQREYIRRALLECCDVSRIIGLLPAYLSGRKIDPSKDAKLLIDDLSDAIVDTRNYLVHAKAAYEKHGKECPDTDLPQFLRCMREVAYQTIVWYHSLPEHARVTNS